MENYITALIELLVLGLEIANCEKKSPFCPPLTLVPLLHQAASQLATLLHDALYIIDLVPRVLSRAPDALAPPWHSRLANSSIGRFLRFRPERAPPSTDQAPQCRKEQAGRRVVQETSGEHAGKVRCKARRRRLGCWHCLAE